MSRIPDRGTRHRADLRLRLSPQGLLRRHALLSALGVAVTVLPISVSAAAPTFGSAAWFAQVAAAQRQAPPPAASGGNATIGGAVVTPAQALINSRTALANFSRAAEAIASQQAAQKAAQQLALGSPNPSGVSDGLGAGGLVPVLNNGDGCAAANTCNWLNANAPTESVAGGQHTVTVKQTAKKAILTWDSFNIGRHTTLDFDQSLGTQADKSNDWVALNRITGNAAPSQILGQIKADGSVYLINQSGIIFGGSAQVNTHSLLASSLTLLSPDLATSNRLFLSQGIQGGSGAILGLGGQQIVASAADAPQGGAITIDAGASITTGELGYALIAAPQLTNNGSIVTAGGQAVLAAGVGVSLKSTSTSSSLLQPILTGQIVLQTGPGTQVDITPQGTLTNNGLVAAPRGNATLLGLNVRQNGVVATSTSVTRPGSVNIVAQDEGAITGTQGRTGSLLLAPGSVTALLPQESDETTTSSNVATADFLTGTISMSGASVTLAGNALIEAPGENVRIGAIGEDSSQVHPVLSDGSIAGRVYLDDGATIDVAGLANVELAMSANVVTIPRLGQNELADSPLQRDGALFGTSITVDMSRSGTRADGSTWVGTPLANVGGYIDQVARHVDQLLLNGGTISLAGNEVIAHSGSLLNLDGGYTHYLGGIIATSRLLAANGAVYDIGSADPSLSYLGFAGKYIQKFPRFNVTRVYDNPLLSGSRGVYESDYIKGGNAGTLNVYGRSATLLDGSLSAHAMAGRHQVGDGKLPAGGKFFAGASGSLVKLAFPDADLVTSSVSYVIQDDAPSLDSLVPGFGAGTALPLSGGAPGDVGNLRYWTPLPARRLEQGGFSNVTVAADDAASTTQGGEVVVASSGLSVQPGGSINLTGSRVTVLGDLSARAGAINLTATGRTDVAGTSLMPQAGGAVASGDIVVAQGVHLDARGQWINDAQLDQDSIGGGALINGGSISLQTLQASHDFKGANPACAGVADCVIDTTGSILLASGSVLDVSSGGRVLPSGLLAASDGVTQGKGGSIGLQVYAPGAGGAIFVPEGSPLPTARPDQGHIEMDGALRSYGFSGGGTLTLRALGIQIGASATPAADGVLQLPADFFTGQGFSGYKLFAEYDATITAGTVVTPTQYNLQPTTALLTAASGTEVSAGGVYTTVGKIDDFHRQTTNLTMYAGDYLNWRTSASLAPDYSAAGISGTLLIERNAAILADAGANITLGSINQVTVDGSIVAHGGAIVLTGDTALGGYSQVPGESSGVAYATGSKSVWLGNEALLDVSGVALLNPLATAVRVDGQRATPRTGRILDGGSVTISNDTGYIIALDGARIDASGASATFDVPGDSAAAGYQPQTVWSDAGTIRLGAGAGLYFNGQLAAHGAVPGARGGSLSIAPENSLPVVLDSGFRGATGLLVQQATAPLPAGALRPGQVVEPGATIPSGVLVFGADRLDGSGIDSLALGVDPLLGAAVPAVPISFAPNLSLTLGRSISLNSSSFIGLAPADGAASQVSLNAPYVSLHGYIPGANYPLAADLPQADPGLSLEVTAQAIDLGGQFSLSNFGEAAFHSSGDIRLVTPAAYDYFASRDGSGTDSAIPGVLRTAGNLLFDAAQVYPASGNRFIVDAVDAAGAQTQVKFERPADAVTPPTPLSAGGSLIVDAGVIIQDGVLRAPDGQIVLGVPGAGDHAAQDLVSYPALVDGVQVTLSLPLVRTDRVALGHDSLTSVSLDGLVIPYGTTVDGQNWQYDGSAGLGGAAAVSVPNLTAPPPKVITINAGQVSLDKGAVIDLSGGGDLQAQEWVPGTGGSRDVLSQFNTSYASGTAQQVPLYPDQRNVYAIIPGYSSALAAYDPAITSGDPLVGKSVFLSGAPGLPAGMYVLLPARYATLPGAYRLVQNTAARDTPASANGQLADGSLLVAGRFVDGFSGASDGRGTQFLLQSGAVWQQYSQYTLSSANRFFAAQAQKAGTVTPLLPIDAGQLVLGASHKLVLDATLDTAAGPGGAGAEVDIASRNLQVVSGDATALDGYVQVDAGLLDQLGASSLLLGGTRQRTAAGDLITAVADNLVVSNAGGDALRAPEVILVANAAGGGVSVDAGSVIQASGDIGAGHDVPITIGVLPVARSPGHPAVRGVSGDGALLRVSNGAPVLVTRLNVPGDDGSAAQPQGLLSIGAGASISGGAAVTLDASGNTVVDPTAQFHAKAIDADSGLITFVDDAQAAGAVSGLVLGPGTLAQFAGADSVTLRSRGAIDFIGNVQVSLDSGLVLSAGSFVGDGGAVSIQAKTLSLNNDLGAPAPAATGGTGRLTLSAGEIDFGGGNKSLSGFASVDASAAQGMMVRGNGKFDFGAAAVDLHTPVLMADSGSDNTLLTSGALRLDGQGGGTALSAAPAGGRLSLDGGSIELDTALQALAGGVSLDAASGDLKLDAGASIAVHGVSKTVFDVTRYASGGSIKLSAEHGQVLVPVGAMLDFSADAGGGDAGSLSIAAADGGVSLAGTLKGAAHSGNLGGSFQLDSGTAVDLDALAGLLAAGGVNHQVQVRARSGNLELDGQLQADAVALTADGGSGSTDATDGNVIVRGTIDSSGARGGQIALYGRSGVDVEGALKATGSDPQQRGGDVTLGTSGSADGTLSAKYGYENVDAAASGRITIGSAASIDVSGGSAGGLSGGTVHIRAPLLADGDVNVAIDHAAQIKGDRELSLEAYATWSTTDAGSGAQHFDGVIDPAGSAPTAAGSAADHQSFFGFVNGDPAQGAGTLMGFVQGPGFKFENRFAGFANFHARPGIDLVNPSAAINNGDITVASAWNLGAGSVGTDGNLRLDYRYQINIAPVLSLRASRDIKVDASLSDGFFEYSNPFGAPGVKNADNSPSPLATAQNPLPLLSAVLDGMTVDAARNPVPVDSTSYRLVAGADSASADPLALGGGAGDVLLDGHSSASVTLKNGDQRQIVAPTMIRTGTGSISIAAAHDIAMLDAVAPGVIYAAGRRADGSAAPGQATVVAGSGGFPSVVDTGVANPEAAGNVLLEAGNDITGRELVKDSDGSRTGKAGNDVSQFWWPWLERSCTFSQSCAGTVSGSSIDFGVFDQGVMSVGGDVRVAAGHNVRDLSVSLPTTWFSSGSGDGAKLSTVGGGNLAVSAGHDVLSGAYFVARGQARLGAGGAVAADLSSVTGLPLSTLLALQDAQVSIEAGNGAALGGIYNPSYLFAGFDSQSYSPQSSVSVVSANGDVLLTSLLRQDSAQFSDGGRGHLQTAYGFVLPASLRLDALNGGITISANGELYPAADGELELIAEDSVRLFNPGSNASFLGLIDAAASVLPSPLSPIAGSNRNGSFIDSGGQSNFDLHTAQPLHAADAQPVLIYSNSGDIIDGDSANNNVLIVAPDKAAQLQAGRDIVNLSFRGQNLYASDVTRIAAGRDLYDPQLRAAPSGAVPYIELGGPGTLQVSAGRDLGPITSANEALNLGYIPPGVDATYPGIRTVGNLHNAFLPRAGAGIDLSFGTRFGSKLQDFANTYIDPSVHHDPNDPDDALGTPDYSKQLVAFVEQYQADQRSRAGDGGKAPALTPQQAWALFQNLPAYQQERFVHFVLFDILNRTGLDFNNPDSLHTQQYARGYQAINTLYPAALGYTANDLGGGANGAQAPVATGTLDMRGSTVQTQQGGDIAILGPGGDILIGSAAAPPNVPPSNFTAGVGPNAQGILTLESGGISIFADRSVLLAQSRIFTEQGGDVLIWSSNGDINAGKGAKTNSEIPPAQYLCDADHFCLVDAKGQVSGAGIATLQTQAGGKAGGANLVAPRGTVDAGDAGIRVSGSLNVAAQRVANADNIQVQGSKVGVPTGLVDTGALSVASAVNAAVAQSADQMANASRSQERAASLITVEVVGYGGE